MRVGYARVSTQEQTLDLQTDALKAAGCEHLYTDIISGAKADRPGLSQALGYARAGDVLVVWKLDRLGRSLKDLIDTVNTLHERSVGFMSLTDQFDTTTAGGMLIFHLFGALAEFERNLIRERTNAGLSAARARGRKGGRPRALDGRKQAQLQTLYKDHSTTINDICQTLNISRATLYRYVTTAPVATGPSRASDVATTATAAPAAPAAKVLQVELLLRVENGSKFTRGKTKAQQEIEEYVLRRYQMQKPDPQRSRYILTISYHTDEDLDKTIGDILTEASFHADARQCFIEETVRALDGSGRRLG